MATLIKGHSDKLAVIVPAAGKKRQKSSTQDRTAEGGKFLLVQTRNIILIVSIPPVPSNVPLLLCLDAPILSLN